MSSLVFCHFPFNAWTLPFLSNTTWTSAVCADRRVFGRSLNNTHEGLFVEVTLKGEKQQKAFLSAAASWWQTSEQRVKVAVSEWPSFSLCLFSFFSPSISGWNKRNHFLGGRKARCSWGTVFVRANHGMRNCTTTIAISKSKWHEEKTRHGNNMRKSCRNRFCTTELWTFSCSLCMGLFGPAFLFIFHVYLRPTIGPQVRKVFTESSNPLSFSSLMHT